LRLLGVVKTEVYLGGIRLICCSWILSRQKSIQERDLVDLPLLDIIETEIYLGGIQLIYR
jgi:hypothetical protein